MAHQARKLAETIRHNMGQTEDGPLNRAVTSIAEAVDSLAGAVEDLADVSEGQER